MISWHVLADDWSFSEIPIKAAGLAGRYLFWFVCLNSTRGGGNTISQSTVIPELCVESPSMPPKSSLMIVMMHEEVGW